MHNLVMRLLLLLLLSLALLPGELCASGEVTGRMTLVRGEVNVRRPGSEKPVPMHAGDMLYVGDLLQTGRDAGAQVVLTDESVVNVSSRTSLRMNQYAFDPRIHRRTAVAKVLEGRARFIVHKQQKESSFKIETAHVLAVFSYADLVVSAKADESAVAVLDGGVSVKNSSELIVGQVRLGDNQTTVVRAKTPPAIPTVLTSQQRRIYSKDAKYF